jgi:hypothetical protein
MQHSYLVVVKMLSVLGSKQYIALGTHVEGSRNTRNGLIRHPKNVRVWFGAWVYRSAAARGDQEREGFILLSTAKSIPAYQTAGTAF